MKRLLVCLITLVLLFSFCACTKDNSTTPAPTAPIGGASIPYQSQLVQGKFSKYDLEDECVVYNANIVFSDNEISVSGSGVSVNGNTVTVTAGGCYQISGATQNGQIIVNVGDIEKVHLVLSGVSIRCEDNAPLWVQNADKVCVTLAADTVNIFSDGTSMPQDAESPNACIYAKDSITFNGKGKLIVNAGLHNGIGCSNDLKFIFGEYEITAKNNGVKGKDSVAILSASMKINAGKDAIKSDETDDLTQGFIYIAGGSFQITAGDDGLQATTAIDLQGGSFVFACAGKTVNSKGEYSIGENVVFSK